MLTRLYQTLRYQLERFLVRGPFSRLLLVMAMIFGISVIGGCIAYFTAGRFRTIGEAIWWAFLRLTDPGYLGDDQGLLLRLSLIHI